MKWKFTKYCLYLFFFLAFTNVACVQEHRPFAYEIAAFLKKDASNPPPKNAILFVGSSSFAKWTDVQTYFPSYPIINRGFGGSSIPDVILYASQIIIPYHPKQIFIYCGENDLAASNATTADSVLERYKTLHKIIRTALPEVQIDFISIKPSPSRWNLEPVIIEANKKIFNFIKSDPKATYLNVHDEMLTADGKVKADIFISDQLHMNEKGYAIWQKIMLPYLMK